MSAYLPRIAKAVVAMDEDAWLSDILAADEALVLPGKRGFGRKLFYRHDESEFGVAFIRNQPCLTEILNLLSNLDFFSVVELRFTPAHSPGLIGPRCWPAQAYIWGLTAAAVWKPPGK